MIKIHFSDDVFWLHSFDIYLHTALPHTDQDKIPFFHVALAFPPVFFQDRNNIYSTSTTQRRHVLQLISSELQSQRQCTLLE